MHLSNGILLLLLGLALSACGPSVHHPPDDPDEPDTPDWILGTFSDASIRDASIGRTAVAHYEFLDDGTLLVGGVSQCEANVEVDAVSYTWEKEADESVVVTLPANGSGIDSWKFHPGEYDADPMVAAEWYCNKLRWDNVTAGVVGTTTYLQRGAVCMKALPPCANGTSCASCETVWCDEPPADCEE